MLTSPVSVPTIHVYETAEKTLNTSKPPKTLLSFANTRNRPHLVGIQGLGCKVDKLTSSEVEDPANLTIVYYLIWRTLHG
jgi:hypothetical protein